MKTTINISDKVMRKLKREAARRGQTMSDLVEAALRLLLHRPKSQRRLPSLPEFRSGGARVDVADRRSLYGVIAPKDDRVGNEPK
ncbi:MAG: ribbon-helix-helix domain-containing protein [Planctomycetota bacterium]